MPLSRFVFLGVCLLLATLAGRAQTAPASPPPAPAPAEAEEAELDVDQLLTAGKALFDAYAPTAVKENYEFPTRQHWDEFAARLQKSLQSNSLEELAGYETQARAALLALRGIPEYQDYADWLEERIDYIEAARGPAAPPVNDPGAPPRSPSTPPRTPPGPKPRPDPKATAPGTPPPGAAPEIPFYDLWVSRLRNRPEPAAAGEFAPALKKIFVAEGLPGALAWIAEAESTFNPKARSPVGARGLFQLMPVTAKAEGLSLIPFDERTHPEKSARAAASLLRRLHGRFDSWPLALAAYNAGEGRVGRTLKARSATTFGEISEALPAETRMYVPKVLATLAVREGVTPGALAPPLALAR